jgi:hypothetical protein
MGKWIEYRIPNGTLKVRRDFVFAQRILPNVVEIMAAGGAAVQVPFEEWKKKEPPPEAED